VKTLAKELVKVGLIGVVVWLAIGAGKPKAATVNNTSTITVPTTKTFSYKNPLGETFYVTSWFEDGVKCSSVTARASSFHVSVSCVKM
jgi:hypothetical protein